MHEGSQRRWKPAPAVTLTVWLHGAYVLVLVLWPAAWPGVLAAFLANHALLGAFGMWPKSSLLGANLTRLPDSCAAFRQVVLTFDDGPDPDVTPRVLALLDQYGATASFFCIGQRAARHPDLVREITRRGHSVENHSDRHPIAFACYGPWTMYREIMRAQHRLADIAGREPGFFRAPFGLRNPFLDPVLARTSLRYVSWTRRGYDRTSGDPEKVLARLTRGLAAGDIILLHDCGSVRSSVERPIVLEVLPRLLHHLSDRGLRPVSLPTALRAPIPQA